MEPSPVEQCRADMAEVADAAGEILQALAAVPPLFGEPTWHGAAADRWAADWYARYAVLVRLLHDVLAEQPHLITRLEEAERRKVVL
ncbi:hypothetical protein GCM10009677_42640 [Sphaerisporangium rubeum]|uniref:Uncharacterized protein YukE n=1 Tax=Sphaerisporangium rubeum TaxID=321317 RepID=A0A7X0IA89_9ACTN|nr:hypothetical protein [Sphaerisporangium rubeum]MBB6471509.1 uncharacterized protein YukE [Sphaerisporangium rubeum]